MSDSNTSPGTSGSADTPPPAFQPTATERKILWTVALTLFLDLASFGIILPVLPYYAESLNASETAVSLLATAFSLAQFAMAPVLGRLSDKYGRRPVMLISVAGSAVASLVLGFAGVLWMVFLARLVSGASKANVSTAQACVADIVPVHARSKYMGLMGAAIGMGFIFGPAIGGLLSTPQNPTLPFFVASGLSALNFLMALVWLPETRSAGERAAGEANRGPRVRLWEALSRTRGQAMGWILSSNFLFFMAFAAMEATFALYTKRRFAWGSTETGYFLTFMGANSAVVQGVLVGRLSNRLGSVGALRLGIGALAAAMLLIAFGPDIAALIEGPRQGSMGVFLLSGILLSAVLLALGNGLSMPSFSTLVSIVSSRDEQGTNMGLRESTSALARVSGPVVAGLMFEYIAPQASFVGAACFAMVSLWLTFGLGDALTRHTGRAVN